MTNESKHTPGPWIVVDHISHDRRKPIEIRACYTNPNAVRGPLVCKINQGSPNRIEAFDNARLIAAAPDLLETLQEWVTAFGPVEVPNTKGADLLAKSRAVIAKAKGKEIEHA